MDTNLRTLADEHPPLYYALVDDRRASISSSETLVMNGSNPFDTPVTNKNAFTEDPVEGKTETIVERSFAAKLLEKGCQANPLYSESGDSLLHILAQGWFEVNFNAVPRLIYLKCKRHRGCFDCSIKRPLICTYLVVHKYRLFN